MKKTVIIYYSLEGHTHLIAQKMSEQLDCPTIRLLLKKEFSKTNAFFKFFFAGQSAVFHFKPELANEKIDLSAYDTLILATPVWAENMSSPIRSFLSSYDLAGKKVFLVSNSDGGSQKKCLASMRKLLPKSEIKKDVSFVKVTEETYISHKDRLDSFCKGISAIK